MAHIESHEHAKIAEVDAIEGKHPDLDQLVFEELHVRTLAGVSAVPQFQPIEQNCSTQFRAKRLSGTRPLDQIWWVVQHSTEGDTARGAASWFSNNDSQGSAHRCMDNNECYRTLEDNEIPWGAPGANYHGIHHEQAGYARWTTLIWSKKHRQLLERDAYKSAVECRKYRLPVRFCKAADLKLKRKCITTHMECTKAFGGTHTDPGTGWPRFYFMLRVKYHYKRLTNVTPVV
jgi:hypothetical protein